MDDSARGLFEQKGRAPGSVAGKEAGGVATGLTEASMRGLAEQAPSVEEIEEAGDFPREEWPASCHGVASICAEILAGRPAFDSFPERGNAPGEGKSDGPPHPVRLVRGHWIAGYAETLHDGRQSPFAGRPYAQHTWVEIVKEHPPSLDGTSSLVVDPTRYVFGGDRPEVYVGQGRGSEYDQGGNLVRMQTMGAWPEEPPSGEPFLETKDLLLSGDAGVTRAIFEAAPSPPPYSQKQLGWIASLHPHDFGGHHVAFYAWLDAEGYGGLAPVDNMDYYLGRHR